MTISRYFLYRRYLIIFAVWRFPTTVGLPCRLALPRCAEYSVWYGTDWCGIPASEIPIGDNRLPSVILGARVFEIMIFRARFCVLHRFMADHSDSVRQIIRKNHRSDIFQGASLRNNNFFFIKSITFLFSKFFKSYVHFYIVKHLKFFIKIMYMKKRTRTNLIEIEFRSNWIGWKFDML